MQDSFMNIPFLNLKAQYDSIRIELDHKIQDIISSQSFILGTEVEALEKEISDYCGVQYGIGVSSGTDGLIACLMALGVGEGDMVITTPFTFFATVGAIARVGARAIFCDIEPKTFNMDPTKLDDILKSGRNDPGGSRIKALLPVHLYGQCANMAAILDLAKNYDLPVLEDGAQAIGAECPLPGGIKRANGMGDMGVFSFYPTKNLGAFGDAGMIVTDREEWAKKLKLLRNHGAKDRYFHEFIGGNFRMDAIQAGVLRVKLRRLDDWIAKRQTIASDYDRIFKHSGLVDQGYVEIPESVFKQKNILHYHTYHQYVIRAQNRDKLQSFLNKRGVATIIYYPLALHLQQCFSDFGYKEGDFPESERATAEVLALPIYPELGKDQLEFIVNCIKKFYESGK
jgi:dTDP-4-amino-4,6-dideoxygalactose transaminase